MDPDLPPGKYRDHGPVMSEGELWCESGPWRPCRLALGGRCYGRRNRGVCRKVKDGDHRLIDVVREKSASLDELLPTVKPAPLRTAPRQRRVVMRTFLNDYSGFGRFGMWVGKSLELASIPVVYDVVAVDEGHRPVSEWQRSRVAVDAPEPWRLQAHYLGFPVSPGRATVYYTMNETTRVRPEHVAEFNRAVAMVVPCRFNKWGFRESGVTVPIYVVPPGLSRDEGFYPVAGQGAERTSGTFRVLFAAMLQAGGMRKGQRDAVEGFLEAFPREEYPDVELIVKVWPSCVQHLGPIPADPRIRVVTDAMSTRELGDLYRSSTVLLAPTRGEGWGLHTIEAMACGVPPIIPTGEWQDKLASATADYVDESCGFGIAFDWAPAEGYYAGMGDWHVPLRWNLVRRLRQAYQYRDETARRGVNAAARAASYTWEASGQRLKEVLVEIGMLADESHTGPMWDDEVGKGQVRTAYQQKLDGIAADAELVRSLTAAQRAGLDGCRFRVERETSCCAGTEDRCEAPGSVYHKRRVMVADCARCQVAGGPK